MLPNHCRESFLLVEDDPNDAALLMQALETARIANPIRWVKRGEEALSYLNGEGRYANRAEFPLPGLVLVDLSLPGLSGRQVIAAIRSNPDFNPLQVVALSSSRDMEVVSDTYQLGANSLLAKPLELDRFVGTCVALWGCWVWASRAEPLTG